MFPKDSGSAYEEKFMDAAEVKQSEDEEDTEDAAGDNAVTENNPDETGENLLPEEKNGESAEDGLNNAENIIFDAADNAIKSITSVDMIELTKVQEKPEYFAKRIETADGAEQDRPVELMILVDFSSIRASSTLVESISHDVRNLHDSDMSTCRREGADGVGLGSTVTWIWENTPHTFWGITIYIGYLKNGDKIYKINKKGIEFFFTGQINTVY